FATEKLRHVLDRSITTDTGKGSVDRLNLQYHSGGHAVADCEQWQSVGKGIHVVDHGAVPANPGWAEIGLLSLPRLTLSGPIDQHRHVPLVAHVLAHPAPAH